MNWRYKMKRHRLQFISSLHITLHKKKHETKPNQSIPARHCQLLTWSTKKLLKVEEQGEALLIGNGRVGYVRVHILQINHELGEGMGLPKGFYLQPNK